MGSGAQPFTNPTTTQVMCNGMCPGKDMKFAVGRGFNFGMMPGFGMTGKCGINLLRVVWSPVGWSL
jgi:hypothetical protein